MGFFAKPTQSSARSADGPSLSTWSSSTEYKTLIPWLAFLFLLASWTYYLSRPAPDELKNRALQMMQDFNQHKESEGAQLSILLTQLEKEEKRNFTRGILQNISHALFVACFLIVAVEIHTRRAARKDLQRHVDDVTKNVFQGVSQRLLGESISSELRSILRENFVKQRAGYQLTFEGTPDGSSDWVRVRQETWYELRNLTNEPQDFPFHASLLAYPTETVTVNGKKIRFPHFVSVTINGEDQRLDELKDSKDPNPYSLRKVIPISRNPLSITVVIRFLAKSKDSVVLSSRYGMESSEVSISNEAPQVIGNCSAVVLHMYTDQVKPRASGHWEFGRALLPGQGWYVYWDRRDAPSSEIDSPDPQQTK